MKESIGLNPTMIGTWLIINDNFNNDDFDNEQCDDMVYQRKKASLTSR